MLGSPCSLRLSTCSRLCCGYSGLPFNRSMSLAPAPCTACGPNIKAAASVPAVASGSSKPERPSWTGPDGIGRGNPLGVSAQPPLLSVAPMMMVTDVHFRALMRLISRHTWLYTEMVCDDTLIYNKTQTDRWLEFPEVQRPLVLQLGGSDPEKLAQAVQIADAYGYDELNLNCGCPSDKVAGRGCFGARLMLDPQGVGEAVATMAQACSTPVTVKCRIGVDDFDSYELLCNFVRTVSEAAPVTHFIIHARKAILKGLSPDQNRKVPPLKYEYVYALVRDFPHLRFTLNGGILNCNQAVAALERGAHGVMIGRAAYKMPWATLADADRAIFGVPNRGVSRRQVLEEYAQYADGVLRRHGPNYPTVRHLAQPLLGMFHGDPGGGRWRNAIDGALQKSQTLRELLDSTLHVLPDSVLDALPVPCQEDGEISVGEPPAPVEGTPSPTLVAAT